MTTPKNQQETIAMWGLFGIGLLLIVIAIFTNPVGPSPDSGIVDLGVSGTRWLLGSLGGAFVLGGIWTFFRSKSSGPK
jgi:predicted phage tail protein